MTSQKISMSARFGGQAALVVAAVFVLAGCAGGSPSPGASPDLAQSSASAAATPTPTPTPTPTAVYRPADASGPAQNVPVPVLPAVAKTETKEGLEAFAKYWYSTLSYAYETGDTEPLVAASSPDCRFCMGLRDGIEQAWDSKRWVVGGKITTPAVTATLRPGVEPYAAVQVVQQAVEIRKPDGGLYQEPTPATNSGSRAGAVFGTNGWTIAELGFIR